MAVKTVEAVIEELNKRREALKNALADGAAKDYVEYRAMSGEIQGLSLAHSLLTDLVRNLEFDDD
jgi:predicted  nucleic acid-binding Zn-ribbon protein